MSCNDACESSCIDSCFCDKVKACKEPVITAFPLKYESCENKFSLASCGDDGAVLMYDKNTDEWQCTVLDLEPVINTSFTITDGTNSQLIEADDIMTFQGCGILDVTVSPTDQVDICLKGGDEDYILQTINGVPTWAPISNELTIDMNNCTLSINDGNTVDMGSLIQNCETLTELNWDESTRILTYVDEAGDYKNISIGDNTIQQLSINEGTCSIEISGGNSIQIGDLIKGCQLDTFYISANGGAQEQIELGQAIDFVGCRGIRTSITANNTIEICLPDGGKQCDVLAFDMASGEYKSCPISEVIEQCGVVETVTVLTLTGSLLQYTNENGDVVSYDLCEVVRECETVTTLVEVTPGVIEYTNESGVVTNIDTGVETLTSLNLIGENIVYIDEQGNSNTIDLCNVVSACESITTLIPNGDGTYTYISEDGTNTVIDTNTVFNETVTSFINGNNGTVIYTKEDGTTDIIDICSIVSTYCNIQEVVTTIIDNGNDSFTYTNESGSSITIDYSHPVESLTSLIDNGDNTFSYTNEAGVVSTVNYCCDDVLTRFEDNNDGTVSYFDELGNESEVSICDIVQQNCVFPVSTMVDNGDGTYTFSNEDGDVTIVDTNTAIPAETVTTLVDNGDESFTYTNEAGAITTFTVTHPNDVLTTFINNGDGTYTYTNEDGTDSVLDICQAQLSGGCIPSIGNNGDGTFTFEDGYGNQTVIDINEVDFDINEVEVNGSVFTFTSENGATVVADVCQMVANNCDTTVVDNGDGTYTHTSIGGNTTIIDTNTAIPAEVVTSLIDNGDNTFSYTNEDGVVSTISYCCDDIVTTLVDNNDNTITYTDELGNVTNIAIPGVDTTIVDNNDGTFTYTNESGTPVSLDVCKILEDGGCTDSLIDNGDGSYTHTSLSGVVTNFDTSHPDDINTTLIDNGDNTFTYINELGVSTTVNYCCEDVVTTITDNNDGTYTYTNELGDTVVIDTNVVIPAESVTTLIDNNNDSFTYVSEDGTITTVDFSHPSETITSIVDNADGTFSYTNEAGNPTTIDICSIVDTYCDISTEFEISDGTTTEVVDGTNPVTIIGANDAVVTLNGTTFTVDVDIDVCAEMLAGGCISTATSTIATGNLIGTHESADGTITNYNESVTTLVDNGDGSFTYISEDGTSTTFTVPVETVTTMVDNDDNTYTYSSEDGTSTIIDTCSKFTVEGCDGSTLDISCDDTLKLVGGCGIKATIVGGELVVEKNEGTEEFIGLTSVDGNSVTLSTGEVITFSNTFTDDCPCNVVVDVYYDCNDAVCNTRVYKSGMRMIGGGEDYTIA